MEPTCSFGESKEMWDTSEFYGTLQRLDQVSPPEAKELRNKALGGEVILVVSKHIPALSLVEEGVA
jgi:hypothetical protein